MITDLNQDQKIKLKRLFEQKNYSKFQLSIEKLGSIDELPVYLKMGYAGSIVLNSKSKKEDFVKATVIFENIYSKDKSNLSALHNLILSSLKADLSGYVLPHLIDFYQKNNMGIQLLSSLRCRELHRQLKVNYCSLSEWIQQNDVNSKSIFK